MDKMKKDRINFRNELYLVPATNPLPPTLSREVIDKPQSFNKLLFLIGIMSLIFIIQINQISAIGITPGRTTVNFEPGLAQEVSFSVVNTEHKNMNVVFFVQGELNNSITLSQALAKFSSSDDSKSFMYKFTLPQKFDKPGLYEAQIVALEMPEDLEKQGTFIGATVAVATQLHVYVPYPNKYLDGELSIVRSDDGKILFLLPLTNRGKLDVVNAKAVIDIYTALNEKVATIETDTQAINSLERKELNAEWVPSVNPGKYLAIATIVYDNEILTLSKEFNIGESVIEIEELYVQDFQLGEIAKFNALVNNKWGNEIKDSFLNILVYNNEGEIMADFKSPNYNIPPLAKTEMVAYWDTGGVQQGNYDGKVILKYGERSTERNIELKISESNIEISGITGKVLVRGKGKSNINSILIIAVVALVLVNIIWFFVVRRFMKKRK